MVPACGRKQEEVLVSGGPKNAKLAKVSPESRANGDEKP